MSVDPAAKKGANNDFTAITLWAARHDHFHLLRAVKGRWNVTETVAQIVTLADEYRVNEIIVEDTSSGTAVLELLQQKRSSVQCIGRHPTEDKLTRLLRQLAKIESGKITLPKDAPWVEEFLDEVVNFPNARHDDYVDSLVQFLEWADGEGYFWLLGQIRIPLMPKETYEPWAYR